MAPVVNIDASRKAQLRRLMLAWGRRNFQAFPWRHETSPWLTLIAEVLLQRTQAKQVVQAFETFRRLFPTPGAILSGDQMLLERTLFPLGLRSRVHVIRSLANIAAMNNGMPPEDIVILRTVRGVGSYTSAAWISLHRGRRAVIIDANVYRWLGRMFDQPYGRDPRRVRWVAEIAEQLTPQRVFRAYNYAVLDFTMTVCSPRQPQCETCVFSATCAYATRNLNVRSRS
jgi:A/G-specific adenine glycosylase